MDSKQFADSIRRGIVLDNARIYRQLLDATDPSDATDQYWKDFLTLYGQLDDAQRTTLLAIMRQVIVDTTSNVLAILDGVSRLPGQDQDFALMHGNDRLDGDLQDAFLELEERNRGASSES